jgi:hypothetical protein
MMDASKLKPEEIAVLICDLCGHAHGAHTYYDGCVSSRVFLLGHLKTRCECPGFLKMYEDKSVRKR